METPSTKKLLRNACDKVKQTRETLLPCSSAKQAVTGWAVPANSIGYRLARRMQSDDMSSAMVG